MEELYITDFYGLNPIPRISIFLPYQSGPCLLPTESPCREESNVVYIVRQGLLLTEKCWKYMYPGGLPSMGNNGLTKSGSLCLHLSPLADPSPLWFLIGIGAFGTGLEEFG